MSLNLTKNEPFSLTKAVPTLRRLLVGLGWDANRARGQVEHDLDASAIITGEGGLMLDPSNAKGYVGYARPNYTVHGVSYGGDNRTGDGDDGDKEFLEIDLSLVGDEVKGISFPVSIYAGRARGQSFAQISNAYIRLVDIETGTEIARLNLTEMASNATAIIFGTLHRVNGEWSFISSDDAFEDGLSGVCRKFGLNIPEEKA